MGQLELNNIHGYITDLISYYQSGIVTTIEFKNAIDRIGVIGDPSKLLDPATGLRYP